MTQASASATADLAPPPTGFGRALLVKTIGNAGLNAATLVLNLAIALLLSHFLGPRGYGAYAFAVAWATLLAVPALLGLPMLVVREVAAARVNETWGVMRGVIRRSNQGVLVAAAVVCGAMAVVVAATGWPAPPLRTPTLIGLVLVPLVGIVSLRQSAMQGLGQVVLGRTPEGLVNPLLVIAGIVALRLALGDRLSAGSTVAVAVGAAATAAVIGARLLRRALPRAARDAEPVYATRAWAMTALPLMLMGAISTANDQLGTIFVGALGSAREVGVFAVASRAASLIPFLLLAAVPTLMPSVVELHTRKDIEKLQHLLTRAARIVFYASTPIVIGVIVLAAPLLRVFGADFVDGATPLRILAIGQIVNIATGFPGMALIMIREAGKVTRIVACGTVANVLLCALLIPKFGASGAATAGATSIALTNVLLSAVLWRTNRLWSPAFAAPR